MKEAITQKKSSPSSTAGDNNSHQADADQGVRSAPNPQVVMSGGAPAVPQLYIISESAALYSYHTRDRTRAVERTSTSETMPSPDTLLPW